MDTCRVVWQILHPPGEDAFNEQESAEERWRPILGVEQIIVSVRLRRCPHRTPTPSLGNCGTGLEISCCVLVRLAPGDVHAVGSQRRVPSVSWLWCFDLWRFSSFKMTLPAVWGAVFTLWCACVCVALGFAAILTQL